MDHWHSIILRNGLTMGGIVLLALFSMATSMFIAESSKGDAAAINLAGSLRMQSYRIATRLQDPVGDNGAHHERVVTEEIRAFERRLAQLWQTGAIALTADDPRHQTLKAIEIFWQGTLQPVLETAIVAAAPAAYLQEVDDFVVKIDTFVKLLEEDTEAKILLLRLVQGLALFMTVALVLIAMHQLHSGVVTPLRDLVELAHRARRGDLSVRVQHVGPDELGVLGQAFNLMAADLSTLYADLEARVEAQTQALRLSNRSLELLYHTTRRLGESALDDATYQALLAEIEKLTGLGSVRLCLIDPVRRQATRVFTAGAHPAKAPPFCERSHCEPCLGDGATHPLAADRVTFSIPIQDQQQQFGILIVRNPGLDSVAAWQLPLLEAVARHIATTLQANQQSQYRGRLALLEERNAMARDLHDSLAQALSYLKIQIARLHASTNSAELTLETRDIIAELREGLNNAYRQLRELITTFRLKIEHPRLEDSLREVAREFSRRSGLPVELDQTGWTCMLNPNEQIHLMQIIREALHNAIKHARARQIRIRLNGADRGQAIIEITDDGVGLPESAERNDHFGLSIMRERARYLGGALYIHSQPGQGVRVRLCFQPAGDVLSSSAPILEVHHAG
ncbi:MAG: type IV pili methyl-accepting chemotaxis transducer N-terminal domain-containing protein [Gammaproteobacteria bacterium]|nr:type IV pili methyl-accepting chemotaxis transducer N-terminal domain-containing protein [Gammaproteobacteria bacterium]